ncbi:MAG: DUF58 domain-containing protein [Puniceicoccales bacterium]
MSSDAPDGNLIDPDAFKRASALGMLARKIVEGYKVGEHRSPLKGFAIEFAQHREYSPGDDTRHLDWKMFGRSEKLFIKQYEQDTNFTATVMLDCSRSMNFGSGEVTKFNYAKLVAAALSHAVLLQRDAVSLGFLAGGQPNLIPRVDTPGRMPHLMNLLADAEATGDADLGADLAKVSPAIKPRSIVVILSDLLGDEQSFIRAIQRFQHTKTEVIVFHVLDHAELTLPYKDKVRFEGLEGEMPIITHPEEFAEAYREEVEAFCKRLRIACESHDAHYVLADTSKSVGELIGGYLIFRQRTHR